MNIKFTLKSNKHDGKNSFADRFVFTHVCRVNCNNLV